MTPEAPGFIQSEDDSSPVKLLASATETNAVNLSCRSGAAPRHFISALLWKL